jgi:hypothetical protein
MTDYSDVPQVTVLHSENERVQLAISNIDGGATLTMFSIGAPPQSMGLQPQSPTGMVAAPIPLSVTITLDAPASDQLMADIRTWLVDRQANLESQLAGLGVTNPPALRK